MLTPEGEERADLYKIYLGSKSFLDAFAWFCADASTVDVLPLDWRDASRCDLNCKEGCLFKA